MTSTATGKVEGGTSTGMSGHQDSRIIRLKDRVVVFNPDMIQVVNNAPRGGKGFTILDAEVIKLMARVYAVMVRRRMPIGLALNEVLRREPPGPRGPKRRYRLKPLPSPTISRWHGRHRARGVL